MLYHGLCHERSSVYHDVIGYEVAYAYDEACLAHALDLSARHPALRTALRMEGSACRCSSCSTRRAFR